MTFTYTRLYLLDKQNLLYSEVLEMIPLVLVRFLYKITLNTSHIALHKISTNVNTQMLYDFYIHTPIFVGQAKLVKFWSTGDETVRFFYKITLKNLSHSWLFIKWFLPIRFRLQFSISYFSKLRFLSWVFQILIWLSTSGYGDIYQ